MEKVRVRMLGGFSLEFGGRTLEDHGNRVRRSWLLLAYLLCNRERGVPQKELIDLLWGEEGSVNPSSVMKTTLHRARSLLSQLDEAAGPGMILTKRGVCRWNPEAEVSLDAEEFESLCRRAGEAEAEERLELYLRALSLYQGDFLGKYASEMWIVPISAYYHGIYVQAALEALALLEDQERQGEIAALCRRALVFEPYSENLYQHLMRSLLALGENGEAAAVFEDMSKLLSDNFGIDPAQESRRLYQEALRTVNTQAVSMRMVQEQLQEGDGEGGALMCGYDSFKTIYHAEARALARSGDAVHLCLLSVSGPDREALSKRSLDRYMAALQELIRGSLRKGDVAARCSVSQYILLLPQATYESSCMVCERLTRSFADQYPRSPVFMRYAVQALTPNV